MDSRTLLVAVAVLCALQTLVLFAQYRTTRRYPGLGWWTAGSLLIGVGMAAGLVDASRPLIKLTTTMPGVVFVGGMVAFYVGLRRFLGEPVRWLPPVLVLGAEVVARSSLTVAYPQPAALRAASFAGLAVASSMVAWVAWRHRSRELWSTMLLAWVYFLTGIVYALLAVMALAHLQTSAPASAWSGVADSGYGWILVASSLWTFGFIMMVSQRLQADVRREHLKLQRLFQLMPNATVVTRLADSRIVEVNEAFTQVTGYQPQEVVGRTMPEIGLWEDLGTRQALLEEVTAAGVAQDAPAGFRRKDGSHMDGLVSSRVVDWDGDTHMVTVTQDVTAQSRLQEDLRERTDFLESLIDHANAPIIVWDPNFRITRFNHAFERLTGLTESEVLGRSVNVLFPPEETVDATVAMQRALTGEHWQSREIVVIGSDGSPRTVLWNSATIFAADGVTPMATMAQGQDITARKELEAQLEIEASTDALTGLCNRRQFWELGMRELARSARHATPLALAVIDLDGFKALNDGFGHLAGDAALVTVAEVLSANVRNLDVLARLGGDEFVLLMPDADADVAWAVVERLRLQLAQRALGEGEVQLTLEFTAGVASANPGDSLDDLIARADAALYEAKRSGRNRTQVAADPVLPGA